MRPRPAWKLVLKGLGGFLLGLAIWAGFSPLYRTVVMAPAELVLHIAEANNVSDLRPGEKKGVIVNRTDFPPESPRPVVPLVDLTFNVILLFALFALSRETFSNRNVAGLMLSLAILWVTHVLALVVRVEKIYALQLGAWSTVHYGAVSRNVWGSLDHFYRIVGMYAIAFALWWILRGENWRSAPSSGRSPRKRGR